MIENNYTPLNMHETLHGTHDDMRDTMIENERDNYANVIASINIDALMTLDEIATLQGQNETNDTDEQIANVTIAARCENAIGAMRSYIEHHELTRDAMIYVLRVNITHIINIIRAS